MPAGGVHDLKHEMPAVTLEIGALTIVLVERDPQLAMVEVDGPVQVLHLEKDLFDTEESHPISPSAADGGNTFLLAPAHWQGKGECRSLAELTLDRDPSAV